MLLIILPDLVEEPPPLIEVLFLAELFECKNIELAGWLVDWVKVAATLELDLLQVHLFSIQLVVEAVVVGAEPIVVVLAAIDTVLNKLGTILDCCAIDHWLSFDEAKLELDEALAIVQRR